MQVKREAIRIRPRLSNRLGLLKALRLRPRIMPDPDAQAFNQESNRYRRSLQT